MGRVALTYKHVSKGELVGSCCLAQGAGLGGHLEGKKAAGRLKREGLYGYMELIHVVMQQKKFSSSKIHFAFWLLHFL